MRVLKEWSSRKAMRKALREAKGMSPKPGRHSEKLRNDVQYQLSVAIQKDIAVGAEIRRNFI